MLIADLRAIVGQTPREFANAIDATEQSVRRWEMSGLEIGDKRIHALFRKQMEKMRKKAEVHNG